MSNAGLAQLVERNFAKVKVVGSNPISRSNSGVSTMDSAVAF